MSQASQATARWLLRIWRKPWLPFGAVALVAIASLIAFSVINTIDSRIPESAAARDTRLTRESWTQNSAKISAAIDELLSKKEYIRARDLINRYAPYSEGKLESDRTRMRTGLLLQDLAMTPADKFIAREGILMQLVQLNPGNVQFTKDLTAARSKVAAYKIAEAKQLAATQKAERARRRSQGVAVGMSQDEVLQSSWGRPENINSTITPTGTSEQWVYGSGNYLYFANRILYSIQTRK